MEFVEKFRRIVSLGIFSMEFAWLAIRDITSEMEPVSKLMSPDLRILAASDGIGIIRNASNVLPGGSSDQMEFVIQLTLGVLLSIATEPAQDATRATI